MAKTLKMTFITDEGEKSSLSVNSLKDSPVTQAEISSLMDLIIEKNIFTSTSGNYASKHKAYITENSVTEFEM